jgi:hypothetical protein
MVKSLSALTGIAAIVGFILTQRMKYQKRSLEYQKEISDHFYFRNVSNNSGIFDTLVGSAEDQEFKEATLAYLTPPASSANASPPWQVASSAGGDQLGGGAVVYRKRRAEQRHYRSRVAAPGCRARRLRCWPQLLGDPRILPAALALSARPLIPS